MRVLLHPEAEAELASLPAEEKAAMDHAIEKLEAMGPRLPFPHQSALRGIKGLRELRPRGGRSPWRAFYRQVGEAMIIGAIGAEAKVDPRGFEHQTKVAQRRLDALQTE